MGQRKDSRGWDREQNGNARKYLADTMYCLRFLSQYGTARLTVIREHDAARTTRLTTPRSTEPCSEGLQRNHRLEQILLQCDPAYQRTWHTEISFTGASFCASIGARYVESSASRPDHRNQASKSCS